MTELIKKNKNIISVIGFCSCVGGFYLLLLNGFILNYSFKFTVITFLILILSYIQILWLILIKRLQKLELDDKNYIYFLYYISIMYSICVIYKVSLLCGAIIIIEEPSLINYICLFIIININLTMYQNLKNFKQDLRIINVTYICQRLFNLGLTIALVGHFENFDVGLNYVNITAVQYKIYLALSFGLISAIMGYIRLRIDLFEIIRATPEGQLDYVIDKEKIKDLKLKLIGLFIFTILIMVRFYYYSYKYYIIGYLFIINEITYSFLFKNMINIFLLCISIIGGILLFLIFLQYKVKISKNAYTFFSLMVSFCYICLIIVLYIICRIILVNYIYIDMEEEALFSMWWNDLNLQIRYIYFQKGN